jgi:hypothetical protein
MIPGHQKVGFPGLQQRDKDDATLVDCHDALVYRMARDFVWPGRI